MKNLRAILLLFLANTISGFSQGITVIAIPWYFSDTLDSPGLFGKIYMAVTIVSLFWGLYVGTLVDRYNRKHLFLLENLAGAFILLTASAYGFYAGEVSVALVSLVFASTFWIYNIHYPTLYAFAQEILERDQYQKLASYIEVQGQLTTMIAGAMAAILLSGASSGNFEFLGQEYPAPFSFEAWSLPKIFLLDGCTYLLSSLVIASIAFVPLVKRYKEGGGVIAQLKTGIEFLKVNPSIFLFGNAAYFIFVTIMVANFFLFPNLIKSVLNGSGSDYAIAEMAYALGAIGAGLFVRYIFNRTNYVMACIVLSLLGAAVFFSISYGVSMMGLLVLMAFLALSNSGSRIMRITYLMERIPNQFIGRAGSVFQVINVVFRIILIGSFSLAFFTENISYAFFILGFGAFIAALILLKNYRTLVNLKSCNLPEQAKSEQL